MALTDTELKAIVHGITDAVMLAVGKIRQAQDDRIAAIEREVSTLPVRALKDLTDRVTRLEEPRVSRLADRLKG